MEARESQDLFNQIADVLDFEPQLFNQKEWGTQLTLEKYKDTDGVENDVMHVSQDYGDIQIGVLGNGSLDSLSECGTSCCVAGWAALVTGWHPTITVFNNGEYSETYEARRRKQEGDDRYLENAEHKIFELEYGYIADRPWVINQGWSWSDALEWSEGILTLVDGTRVSRVDLVAQKALGLSQEEASVLFDSRQKWDAEDFRLMGKGEDIIGSVEIEMYDQYGSSEESLSL
jgi:hypothetical protein|tara:strand:- start:2694 stop:3386 length:693 start_codon:yes stop_codon:yes gene_type:complete